MECSKCGAENLEPGEACDCLDEQMALEELEMDDWIPFTDVPAMSRDDFYLYLSDTGYITGLVDPDDNEVTLAATVVTLDRKLQEALKEIQRLKPSSSV